MNKTELHKFLRFCIVGGIGFIVDGGLLQCGIIFLGLGPIIARVPSFLTAVLVTWYLNKNFTFQNKNKGFLESFPIYISTNSVGLAINFGTYSAGVLLIPFMNQYPLIPLAIGAVIAMFFNYFAARWIFNKDN